MENKIGIFYGSTRGKTEYITSILKDRLAEKCDIYNIVDGVDPIEKYDQLILLTPTYGAGQLQEDWQNSLESFKKIDFSNKKIAFIGRGNQGFYAATFVDGVKILYDIVVENNGTVGGFVSTEGYIFEKSQSVVNNKFICLPLDELFLLSEINEKIDCWLIELDKFFK